MSEEALRIAEKRREMKGRGERERYTQLNAEFQRIPRRDKKTLSERCKVMGKNNRIGKTRDLFKKIGDTKGTFHTKIGTVKDRNSKDLREAEDIKKWWQNTQKNYTNKVLMTQISFTGGSGGKESPCMQETWVQSLGQEDSLEKEMATHSSILAWRIPWTEEPGGLQSMGSQRVRYDLATKPQTLMVWSLI